ncbi:MAG: TRAM domain-containing protein [Flavobacteriales bacterium Tduv]
MGMGKIQDGRVVFFSKADPIDVVDVEVKKQKTFLSRSSSAFS